ncbi:hypothetical protein [Virgibacillus sp. Bac332]|uniref:hypothetical protein n=1 Tax=Virgibacillus sp. Bac332 TaxID=2419842 RepID=UPI000EF55076|nr:hypothetical protein [Virgibacillus sp. Bac332]
MEDRLKKLEKKILHENYLMSEDDDQEGTEQPKVQETEQTEYKEFEKNKTVQTKKDEEVDQKRSKLVNFSKKKVEETHNRTFLVENTLFKRLNNLSKGKHGFKT